MPRITSFTLVIAVSALAIATACSFFISGSDEGQDSGSGDSSQIEPADSREADTALGERVERIRTTDANTNAERFNNANQDSASGNAGEPSDSAGEERAEPEARAYDEEDRRRCLFWALNHLQPVVYQELKNTDPRNMDDLDRILWRSALHGNYHLGYYHRLDRPLDEPAPLQHRQPGIDCRSYWAEPINQRNAELRNDDFERGCRQTLREHAIEGYQHLAYVANEDPSNQSGIAYRMPNQYARLLQWLDIPGQDLLQSENPTYRILEVQSANPYAHRTDWFTSRDQVRQFGRDTGQVVDMEWVGIVSAAGLSGDSGNSGMQYCHAYYPQLFYGYWIPFDSPIIADDPDWDEPIYYDPAVTPIYLPVQVAADRVAVGFPLGATLNYYALCRDSYEVEEAGYYYVEHPKGHYCERID